jgi:hypothetical protein
MERSCALTAYGRGVPVLFEYAPPWVWVLICGGLAVFYAISWPRLRAAGLARDGLRYIVLRWFHPLVWVLLGFSLGLFAAPIPVARVVAQVLAVLALIAYVAFAAALLVPSRAG